MNTKQKIIPISGVQMDVSPLYIDDKQAPYLKDVTYDERKGMFTPSWGCEIVDPEIALPEGKNIPIGGGLVEPTGDYYVMLHNSNKDHTIYRIRKDGTLQIVSISKLWNFVLNPEHFIGPTRFTYHVFPRYNRLLKKEELVTIIMFCDDINPVRSLCVEDCIATQTFTTPNSYFNVPGHSFYREDWLNLGVSTPNDCIKIEEVERDVEDPDDLAKPSRFSGKAWQFRIRYYNVWNQDSEHGIISEQYINVSGNSCIENSQLLPRLLRLKFSAGSPIIDKIQISFRNLTGNQRGYSVQSDWYLYDTIDCWKPDDTKNWWQRSRNNPWQEYYNERILAGDSPTVATKKANSKELLKYNPLKNEFEYFFGADKQWTPLPVTETNRIENFLAKTCKGIFSINKNVVTVSAKRGFPKISESTLDKISFSVEKPEPENDSCKIGLKKVTIWGVIWNPHDSTIVPIRKDGTNIIFGNATCANNNPYAYDQVLPANQSGIIGCLRGTKYYTVSKQYSYDLVTGNIVDIDLNYVWGPNQVPLQKWEFDVPPGTYIFQISSHKSTPNDDYQSTSTFTVGQTSLTNIGSVVNENKELLIDCSTGNVEIKSNLMMIYDLTRIGKGCTFADATSVVCGYLYEDQVQKRPVSGARVVQNRGNDGFSVKRTDHNGFYFCVTRMTGLQALLYGKKDGQTIMVASSEMTSDAPFSNHYKFGRQYVYQNTDEYKRKDQIIIKGKIQMCGSSIGVGGVLVLLSNVGFAITDSSGNFKIVAHDRFGENTTVEQTTEYLYVGQKGQCQIVGCNTGSQCVYSFPVSSVLLQDYSGQDREIDIGTVSVKLKTANLRGPKMGGRYQLGIITHDWLGRVSFAQTKDDYIVDIPSLQETKTYRFSKIKYAIDAACKFPDYVRKISFAITENMAWDDDISWVAERVQFIDNSGNENKQSPTHIRLYYESLSEYNKINNFSTTTGWEFITNEQALVIGDFIQIVANGDGKIYDKVQNHLVTYDKLGKFVQIEYNEAYAGLKDGALIKIIRPAQSQERRFFYELCTIDVLDGYPQSLNGELKYFDSYLLSRQIPVPVEKKKSEDQYGEEITTDENINEIKSFPFLFEHHSPSDRWGYQCRTRGRVNVENKFENEFRYPTELAVSKSIFDNGVINGLHYFAESDSIRYDVNEWSSFTAVVAEVSHLLILCETDNMVVGYADNAVRVDQSGRVVSSGGTGLFGRPERKIGNNYGCKSKDIFTIRKESGMVCFLDSSRGAVVFHTFGEAVAVTDQSISRYLLQKISAANQNGWYFIGGIDPLKKRYYLSTYHIDETIKGNSLGNADPGSHETMSIGLFTKDIVFHSFLTQYYAHIYSDTEKIKQFFTFINGVAHKHNFTQVPHVNYYGDQYTPCISSVGNVDNTKVKHFANIEVYCKEVGFIAYNIYTSSNQISRILSEWWRKGDGFYAAAFLCDMNSTKDAQSKLLDGDTLYGQYIVVFLKPDNYNGEYFEWTGNIINLASKEISSTQ